MPPLLNFERIDLSNYELDWLEIFFRGKVHVYISMKKLCGAHSSSQKIRKPLVLFSVRDFPENVYAPTSVFLRFKPWKKIKIQFSKILNQLNRGKNPQPWKKINPRLRKILKPTEAGENIIETAMLYRCIKHHFIKGN